MHDIRNPWTAVSTLLVLISSVYRDIPTGIETATTECKAESLSLSYWSILHARTALDETAAPCKTTAVGPLTIHLTNYPNKTSKTRCVLMEKQEQTYKRCSSMDSYTWVHQYRSTSKKFSSSVQTQERWLKRTDSERDLTESVLSAHLDVDLLMFQSIRHFSTIKCLTLIVRCLFCYTK